MARKEQSLTKEQLEAKRNQFVEQQGKVVKVIEEYNTLYIKLSGAIETITLLLENFKEVPEEVKKDEKSE